MCGIFAHFSKNSNVNKETLRTALVQLRHRGPDANAYWIANDKKIGLAQTRLSIVDLNLIEMPISNEDNQILIIANGEFYGHDHIRESLIKKGHAFKTQTDTEIALHLYEEHGMDCLKDLRGEFSFIIWDNRIKTLFVARDRFGIKPLYYSVNSDGLYFSSEIPCLIKTGSITPEWDTRTLFNSTHCNLNSDETYLKNIFQLPPGSYLAVNQSGHRIVQYWEMNYPLASDKTYYNSFSEQEIIQDISNTLNESIALRLASDVPIACYLSGGLDSSTLLGMASKISGRPLDTFTISFDNEKVDESAIAIRSADNIESKLHTLRVTEIDIANSFERAVMSACTPMANAAGVARYLLSNFASQHDYKVVFSGEGSDEIFLGYNFMVWEALTYQADSFKFDNVEEYKDKMHAIFPVDRSNTKVLPKCIETIQERLGYLPKWVETQGYFNASHRALFADELLQSHQHYNPYAKFLKKFDINSQMLGRQNVLQTAYLWMRSFFPNNMLNWIGDRVEMAHSIEARLPFLDHVLFEKVRNIPVELNIKGGIEKYVLRQVAKPYITDEIYRRQKFMFQAPPMLLSKSSKSFQLSCDLIASNIDNLPMYNKKRVMELIDNADKIEKSNWLKCFDTSTTLTTLASMAVLTNGYGIK